jgi:hypothetical protein
MAAVNSAWRGATRTFGGETGMNVTRWTLLCVLGIASASRAFGASAAGDSVASGDIKEADGNTGQNTNTGAGVKTGHIQDGAVTDAKIAGPISASKIQRLANVVVVAKSGGDYTNPIAALQAITDATPANRYVVRIMPGTYSIGAASLQMKPYVDIEGSGQEVTVLSGSFSNWGEWNNDSAVVEVVRDSELRNLTVENVGTSEAQATAIRASGGSIASVTARATGTGAASVVNAIVTYQGGPSVTHVTAIASAGSRANGFKNRSNSAATISDATILAMSNGAANTGSGCGVWNDSNASPGPSITNVSIVSRGEAGGTAVGVENHYSPATIRGSSIQTTNSFEQRGLLVTWDSTVIVENSSIDSSGSVALYNYSSTEPRNLLVANSRISGSIVNDNASMKCIGTYGPTFDAVTCP